MEIQRGLVSVFAAGTLLVTACGPESSRHEQVVAAGAAAAAVAAGAEQSAQIDPAVFGREMRGPWGDHVAWTRLFIVSAVAGLDDKDATTERLLRNQADIGEAVAAFYGEKAGAELTALLGEHILIAADIIAAAKADKTAQLDKRSADWYANADDIAEFLADANPAWAAARLGEMMRSRQLADTFAAGIITQFPEKFPA